jgi:glycosyltransferase involved in cell wall biosynthesis
MTVAEILSQLKKQIKMSKKQNPVSVYLFGGEGTGWALDADVETTKQSLLALPDLVRLTSLAEADVIHSVWEYPLLHMDPAMLDGKRVVCHVCNDIMRTFEDPCMVAAGETLGLWIAISRIAEKEIKRLGFRADYIPYSVDTSIFTESIPKSEIASIRRKYNIQEEVFLISNFMRDSSGCDLRRPKEQKGVELFLAIVTELKNIGRPIHLLLAGPRRHWILKQLQERQIPYTYVGKEMLEDDNKINILSPEQINTLYHISDLHLVTSRWEGGPRSVLEASATKTPMLCTEVGMALDILQEDCLIKDFDEAVEKIEAMIINGRNEKRLAEQYEYVMQHHTPIANIARFRRLYESIDEIPRFEKGKISWQRERKAYFPVNEPITRKAVNFISSAFRRKKHGGMTIGLWHEYHKPPYGGGNQFMLALKAAFERHGIHVVVNTLSPAVDVHICNSAWFDAKRFQVKSGKQPIKMIHRIDGPVTLYRGQGSDEDKKIFDLNKRFASATVFQSAYSFFKSFDLGYIATSPTVIHNAVDNNIFHASNRRCFTGKDKLRLISTAWSDNPRKGGPFYKWLDESLDFSRFDYTFVGRVQQKFQNIRYIEPQDSNSLAQILRDHDIYITASQHEPCSNALLEALACGLPSLYRNDGGNRELVGFSGLPFNDETDCLGQLDRLANNFISYQSLIYIKSIDEIAKKYIDLAKRVADYYAG